MAHVSLCGQSLLYEQSSCMVFFFYMCCLWTKSVCFQQIILCILLVDGTDRLVREKCSFSNYCNRMVFVLEEPSPNTSRQLILCVYFICVILENANRMLFYSDGFYNVSATIFFFLIQTALWLPYGNFFQSLQSLTAFRGMTLSCRVSGCIYQLPGFECKPGQILRCILNLIGKWAD